MANFMMMSGLAALSLGLVACATTAPETPEGPVMVTVQFDPNDYSTRATDESARSQCKARGFDLALVSSQQPQMGQGTWDYRAYNCVTLADLKKLQAATGK